MSKRGMDMQGGADRYGGMGGGTETPTETPTKATAAQLAKRKIASMKKSRTAPATSPTKPTSGFGGGFNMSQPNAPAQQQSGFSFGQNDTNGTSTGFSFGQSKPESTGFNFGGQAQPTAPSSFTFGQTAQNGGFTFGQNASSSMSFPPAASNPFSSTNGTNATNTASSGFQGSIFNFNSSQPQSTSTGFTFGASTASKPATPSGPSDADKQEILRREPYLTSAQQKRVEELVGSHLPQSPASYQKEPMDYLPSNVAGQIAEYLRTLPTPPMGATANVESLFVKPYRRKATKPWVSDAEREEFKTAAAKLSPADQEKLAQIVKDEVESLKGKANQDLPSVEYLPNDTQRHMIDSAKTSAAGTPPKPQSLFSPAGSAAPQEKPNLAPSPAADEQPKANPFASIKSNATSTPKSSSGGFSFATPAATSPAKTSTNEPSSAPSFSFAPKDATPAPTSKENASPAPAFSFSKPVQNSTQTQATNDQQTPKPNPFSSISTPKSFFNAPPQATTPKPSLSTGTAANPNAISAPGTETNATQTPATPASKPAFSFGQPAAKTPAPSASNIFNLSTPQAPATVPAQKSAPTFSFGAAPATKAPSLPAFKSSPTVPAAPASSFQGNNQPSDKSSGSSVVEWQKFNLSFKKHLDALQTSDDWSGLMKFYLQEANKLRQAVKSRAQKPEPKHVQTQAATPKPTPPQQSGPHTGQNSSPAPKAQPPAQQPKPSFQFSSPQKPLTATASLFSNILDSPDRPNAATEPPKQPEASSYSAVPSIKPAFNVPKPANTAPSAPPAFQVPKFGNAAPPAPSAGLPKFGGGSSTNFLSAFGASAAKEAAKEKAKRKAEDFDSDEDDEAEWERQDREKQEAKRQALAQKSKKVMKNINGKFEWVDVEEDSPSPVAEAVAPPKAPQASKAAASVFDNKPPQAQSAPSNPFAHLSRTNSVDGAGEQAGDDDADTDEEGEEHPTLAVNGNVPSTPAKTGGLFDRIDKSSIGTQQKEASSRPLFQFSTSTSSTGDNTWKPDSPIKFGTANGSTTPSGSPAKKLFNFGGQSEDKADETSSSNGSGFKFGSSTPKFNFGGAAASTGEPKAGGSLFATTPASGSASPAPSIFSNLGSKPSTGGFSFGGSSGSLAPPAVAPSVGSSIFGSAATSRATTPGATTADESSTAANTDNEEEAATPDPQRNMTSLSAEEEATEDVLFEQKARCRKFKRGEAQPWENKGVGIIRLLKNKESGKPRVLMRLDPSGTIIINANVMKNPAMYEAFGDKGAKLVFAEKEGELSTYAVSFGTKEKASELLEAIKGVI